MIHRLLLGIASLFAILLATATPAGAVADENPTLGGLSDWVCYVDAADGGPSWRPRFRVTTDRGAGVYEVTYSMVPDRRSGFAMPIGSGVVEVVSYTDWGPDGELGHHAERPGVPEEDRTPCDYPHPAPVTIRSKVRFLTPPVKPTFTEIEAFCQVSADDPTIDTNDEYDVTSCTQMLTEMVRPEVK